MDVHHERASLNQVRLKSTVEAKRRYIVCTTIVSIRLRSSKASGRADLCDGRLPKAYFEAKHGCVTCVNKGLSSKRQASVAMNV